MQCGSFSMLDGPGGTVTIRSPRTLSWGMLKETVQMMRILGNNTIKQSME